MKEKIQRIINEQLERDLEANISLTADLADDLKADSIDAAEIIMTIEDEYDVEIPIEKALEIKTLQDILNLLEPLV